MAHTFHVLFAGGYATNRDHYVERLTAEEAAEELRAACMFVAEPTAHLFDSERSPWDEHDAYPDKVLSLTADGYVLESA